MNIMSLKGYRKLLGAGDVTYLDLDGGHSLCKHSSNYSLMVSGPSSVDFLT